MAATPVPSFTAPPDFPALSDRAAGTYNSKAFAWAAAWQAATGPNVYAIAQSAYLNAQEAGTQAATATSAASQASASASTAIASANFKGDWSALTGALAMPACVRHGGRYWVLLSSLANVAAQVPGVSASWAVLDAWYAPGMRNKIINGGFAINQRSYASGAATTAGQYTLDRWKVTGTGGVTFATAANKTTVTIPSGQTLQQVVEGLNLQSGAYILTWEGTAQGRIAGGAYGSSGVAASITGGVNTTIEFGAGTVANVQLEIGTVATQFEHRLYGVELALCQRYYYREHPGSVTAFNATLSAVSTTSAYVTSHFPVPMRVAPTALEQSGNAADYGILNSSGSTACSGVPTLTGASRFAAYGVFAVSSGLIAGQTATPRANSSAAYLGWSAEL